MVIIYIKNYIENRTFLHSVAAAYPQEPKESDKQQLRNLLNSMYFFKLILFFILDQHCTPVKTVRITSDIC
jgi:hypothetical protein